MKFKPEQAFESIQGVLKQNGIADIDKFRAQYARLKKSKNI